MTHWTKKAALAVAASGFIAAAPASATIFEYTMNDGDILTIATANGTGSWTGDDITANFTGDFSQFQGGANPSFSFTLSTLTGTRDIRGQIVEATNRNGNRTHPFMLKTKSGNKETLRSWWYAPVIGGDYIRKITHFTVKPPVDVPAPGVLGLFGLALIALGFGRRRRNKFTAA